MVGFLEILRLYPPSVDQCPDAIIDLAETDPEFPGELALGNLGITFNCPENFEVSFLVIQ